MIWGYPYFRKPPFEYDIGLNAAKSISFTRFLAAPAWEVGSRMVDTSSNISVMGRKPVKFSSSDDSNGQMAQSYIWYLKI